METLDIELALRIYRQQGDAAMVLSLEKVLHIEDCKLMAVRRTSSLYAIVNDLF